jgi:hypothetical protein
MILRRIRFEIKPAFTSAGRNTDEPRDPATGKDPKRDPFKAELPMSIVTPPSTKVSEEGGVSGTVAKVTSKPVMVSGGTFVWPIDKGEGSSSSFSSR